MLAALAIGACAAGLLWHMSGSAWGRSGSYPVVRKTKETAGVGLPGAGEGVCRLYLNVPASENAPPDIMVPPEIFNAVNEGDTVRYRIRALPPAGIEAIDFETGDGAVTWSDGYPFFIAAIAAAGLAAALAALGIAGLLAALFRLRAPPDV